MALDVISIVIGWPAFGDIRIVSIGKRRDFEASSFHGLRRSLQRHACFTNGKTGTKPFGSLGLQTGKGQYFWLDIPDPTLNETLLNPIQRACVTEMGLLNCSYVIAFFSTI